MNISNLNELFMGVCFAAISDEVCRIDQDQWFVGNSFSFVFRIDSLKIENQKIKKYFSKFSRFFQVFLVFLPGFFTPSQVLGTAKFFGQAKLVKLKSTGAVCACGVGTTRHGF